MSLVVMVACVRRALPRTGLPSPPPGDRLMSGSWQKYIKYSYIVQPILCTLFVAYANYVQKKTSYTYI